MREILFRGKAIDGSGWKYGYLIVEKGGLHYMHWTEKCGSKNGACVLTETVGQFTGLCYTTKQKQFEGDVFHLGDPKIKYVIVWKNSGFIGNQIGNKSTVGLDYFLKDMVHIGNIHDNPELLK